MSSGPQPSTKVPILPLTSVRIFAALYVMLLAFAAVHPSVTLNQEMVSPG